MKAREEVQEQIDTIIRNYDPWSKDPRVFSEHIEDADRARYVFESRYGLNGKQRKTVVQLMGEFGISGKRIEKIEEQVRFNFLNLFILRKRD